MVKRYEQEVTDLTTRDIDPADFFREINLSRGWPSPKLLPHGDLLEAAQHVLTTPSISIPGLQYGPDPGYEPLRKSISKWLSNFYSTGDDFERICITGGASQNLACALQVFSDPNVTKRIWMVSPCYYLASGIFRDTGFEGQLMAVPEGSDGIDLKYLADEMEKIKDEKPRGPPTKPNEPWRKTFSHIIYCVPTFSNPSGKTMPLHRRRQLVNLARKYDALVITDDVYDFLQWRVHVRESWIRDPSDQEAYVKRLSDIDRELPQHPYDPGHFGYTMSNGSFSKILGPGVRTGWADCMPKMVYGLSQCGSTKSGGAASQLTATYINFLLENWKLQRNIVQKLIPAYQFRFTILNTAIHQFLKPLGVSIMNVPPKGIIGGYFMWIELPPHLKAKDVAEYCKENLMLTISPADAFCVAGADNPDFSRCIRLCFAWEPENLLIEAVNRIAEAIKYFGAPPAKSQSAWKPEDPDFLHKLVKAIGMAAEIKDDLNVGTKDEISEARRKLTEAENIWSECYVQKVAMQKKGINEFDPNSVAYMEYVDSTFSDWEQVAKTVRKRIELAEKSLGDGPKKRDEAVSADGGSLAEVIQKITIKDDGENKPLE